MNITPGHQQIMPYLIVEKADEFIFFLEKVFDGEVTIKIPRSEGVIMHAEVRIGESTVMLADATEQYPKRSAGMFIYVEDADSTYKKAIEAGSISRQEPQKTEYAKRTAGFEDPFGNTWWPVTI